MSGSSSAYNSDSEHERLPFFKETLSNKDKNDSNIKKDQKNTNSIPKLVSKQYIEAFMQDLQHGSKAKEKTRIGIPVGDKDEFTPRIQMPQKEVKSKV